MSRMPGLSNATLVEYGPMTTALNAVAMATATAKTSDAIDVRGCKWLAVDWSYVLSGAAATDKVTFTFQASIDNGLTFKPLTQTATDGTVSAFAPVWTISAAEKTASLSTGDLGAINIAGRTHVKVIATATDVAGTAGANDKMTVRVRPSKG